MKRLLLLLPLVALAGCKDPQDGVKVTVSYKQFVPGCVRIIAKDDASGDELSTDVAVRSKDPSENSQIVVGIRVPKDWGAQLTMTANAYEALADANGCVNTAVVSSTKGVNVPKGSTKDGTPKEVTLEVNADDADRDGYVATTSGGTDCNDTPVAGANINPGVSELCNGKDDNCAGGADEGFQINEACVSQTNGCAGTYQCDPDNTQKNSCYTPNVQAAWVDEDRDGYGDVKQEQVVVCTQTLPPNRLPLSAPHNDCDDNDTNVHPGATERCNTVDDNCDGTTNEGFAVGTACFESGVQCDGTQQCNDAQNGVVCKPTGQVPTWYPDQDEDLHGQADAGIVRCPSPGAGYITTGRDCDDGNPFIHGDAPELCDSQDNNCNGVTDENSVCPTGGPRWDMKVVGDATNRTWFGVSTYGDGGVWIVGSDGGRAVKEPLLADFNQLQGTCTAGSTPQVLPSVWADPTSGTAYIGRDDGQLIVQQPDAGDCIPRAPVSITDAVTRGLMGFVTADGGVNILGVGQKGTSNDGFTLQWDGGTDNTVSAQLRNNNILSGVHGRAEGLLFSVGKDNTGKSVIYHYVPGATPPNDWVKETGIPNVDELTAVHVVNSKLAYAVSVSGKMLRWNGSTWTAVSNTPVGNYTGVLAFGTNSIYITTDEGAVLRYNGASWESAAQTVSKYGIAGTSPENIWVVGRFGEVFHYPSWPAAPPPP
ncbi:putative metal-binding motif-containing protein [Corallococcus carmarthensis]|uniref:putative metal-binding motif-containing protein n=1 Tax=Corallococcus carmarthensis TaxID=2316728 RepID=UPI00148B9D20|nr:putative metal-binding motif-containing protein [Corallococcus carmarthensis]NOK23336.1 hypothetical protein [Corallococcus carmarthensis]